MRPMTALALMLVVVACSRGEGGRSGNAANAPGAEQDRIRCAIDGARSFAPDCTREVSNGPDGEVWIIRQPDGGFRRFVLIDKGTRIATADGADEVLASRAGANLDVRVAGNRYLFPVASQPQASASSVQ